MGGLSEPLYVHWPVSVFVADRLAALHLDLLRHFEGVDHLDSKVADRALQPDVPEPQLGGPTILRATVDRRRLGAPQRVCPIVVRVEPELFGPRVHNSGVLASRQMS